MVFRSLPPSLSPSLPSIHASLQAYSSVTSNKIQIFAQGFYKGKVHDSDEHWWMYRIEFKNTGRQRVQLLTRRVQA